MSEPTGARPGDLSIIAQLLSPTEYASAEELDDAFYRKLQGYDLKTQRDIILKFEEKLCTINDGVELRPSSIPNAGNGVFATVRFEKGTYITRYEGLYVKRINFNSRLTGTNLYTELPLLQTHLRTLFSMDVDVIGNFYSTPRGIRHISDAEHDLDPGYGLGAFLNHPPMGSKANTRFARVVQTHADPFFEIPWYQRDYRANFVSIQATEDIEAGDELFIDYGEDYWSRSQQPDTSAATKRRIAELLNTFSFYPPNPRGIFPIPDHIVREYEK